MINKRYIVCKYWLGNAICSQRRSKAKRLVNSVIEYELLIKLIEKYLILFI